MKQEAALTYGNIKISPYKLVRLQTLEITQVVNDHARLTFKGIIADEKKDSYVTTTASNSQVKVFVLEPETGKQKILFDGVVLDVKVQAVLGIYYLSVEAVSYTYLLDIKRNKRSFQNPNMTYKSMVKAVISDYSKSDFIDETTNAKAIGTFVMQYDETDWQFLKRMASHFYTSLVAVSSLNYPTFYFGLPKDRNKGKLEVSQYLVKKRMADYQTASEYKVPGVSEQDYTVYEVVTSKTLEPGDEVSFRSRKLVVGKAVIAIKEGLLTQTYELYPRPGLRLKKEYNEAIIGASIQASVLQVRKDTVRAKLDMDDQEDPSTDYWFPYSTIYASEDNTGWYCMPEQGDSIRIYFPSKKEHQGYAISSVRRSAPAAAVPAKQQATTGKSNASPKSGAAPKSGSSAGKADLMADPDNKTFRTKYGKEILLAKDRIVISANGMSITVSDSQGISIVSNKSVTISAGQDISMSSSTIQIEAKKIELSGNENTIVLEDKVSIEGSEIKMN